MGCCSCKLYTDDQAQTVQARDADEINVALIQDQIDQNASNNNMHEKETCFVKSRSLSKEQGYGQDNAQYSQSKPREPETTEFVKKTISGTLKLTPEMLVRKQCITEKFLAHYEIVKKLGQGGFGEVYLVKHLSTDNLRAAKVILRKTVTCEEKLLEETEILKTLDHPNIVKVLEIFADFKYYYIITEFCQGGELLERVKTITNYNEKITASYMKQILSAMMYCHQRNIVHRDLKPENILFDSRDKNANLKVIDFGASEKMIDSSQLTKKIGTPYYVAPEVLSNPSYNEKVDVWSCGVILYILLIGRPPFKGSNDIETLKQARIGKLNVTSESWLRVSESARDLIQKMIVVDPDQRISMKEAFEHPWVQNNEDMILDNADIIKNLGQFSAQNKLKAAILQFISVQLVNKEESTKLFQTFKSLDVDGDGVLSKDELLKGMMTADVDHLKAELLVDGIIQQLDVNESGKVDFTEFISAALVQQQKITINNIKSAFKMFDIDGNGFISKNELEDIFGGIEIDSQAWDDILAKCDSNKDGQIEEKEFIVLLENIQL